jgi:hypothetical protein
MPMCRLENGLKSVLRECGRASVLRECGRARRTDFNPFEAGHHTADERRRNVSAHRGRCVAVACVADTRKALTPSSCEPCGLLSPPARGRSGQKGPPPSRTSGGPQPVHPPWSPRISVYRVSGWGLLYQAISTARHSPSGPPVVQSWQHVLGSSRGANACRILSPVKCPHFPGTSNARDKSPRGGL